MSKYILKNVMLLDGTKEMKARKTSILVNGNKIEKIADNINEEKITVYNLEGKYAIPGLINMHVHLPGSGKFSNGSAKKLVKTIVDHKILHPIGTMLSLKYAKVELMSGVTTLRAVGGVSNFDTKARDLINANKKVGSRLYVANYAIATKNGHMVGTVSHEATSIEEVIKMVDELYNQKVDLIKIMITGGILDAEKLGEPGVLKMPGEFVHAAVTRAHELGLQVACHVESQEGVRIALENGVDTIEHGSDLNEELLDLFKKNNSSFIATLSPAIPIGLLPATITNYDEFVRYNSNFVLNNMIKGIHKCIENDIPVGLGTDVGCPYVPHYVFYKELFYFKNLLNVSPEYTLYLATLGNAKILHKDDIVGSIEENKLADILILDTDPLDDFNSLKKINTVIKDGKMYKNPKVKKYEDIDYALDILEKMDINDELDKYFKDEGVKARLGIK